MVLHHRGVFSYIYGSIVDYMSAKPPMAVMMSFVAALSLSIFSLSWYITSNDMVDVTTTKLFNDMLNSFADLTFCLVNSTEISNPIFEQETVDVALNLKAIISGISISNFSKMESTVQTFWLLPLDHDFHNIGVKAFFEEKYFGMQRNNTVNACVILSLRKSMLTEQMPLYLCKPPTNVLKSDQNEIVKMQPQFHGKRMQKRYQCASELQMNFLLDKSGKYDIYLNLWEKSKLVSRLQTGSLIFLVIFFSGLLYIIFKGRKIVEN
ncbi:uncharacterized protein LOC100200412 isoform X2 [Hydra vulgaris]|uniref:Uncharacterized protein LOC100200412 isoform X2 n=1 Tax=Hydra vulgaris TaxID=6087 RepID=A0ABM4CNW1_HYDVU